MKPMLRMLLKPSLLLNLTRPSASVALSRKIWLRMMLNWRRKMFARHVLLYLFDISSHLTCCQIVHFSTSESWHILVSSTSVHLFVRFRCLKYESLCLLILNWIWCKPGHNNLLLVAHDPRYKACTERYSRSCMWSHYTRRYVGIWPEIMWDERQPRTKLHVMWKTSISPIN